MINKTMKNITKLLPLILLITTLSCKEEKHSHEGHNHDHGHTTTVKENPEAYTYTFEGYETKDGKEYIKVAAESDSNDTTFVVLVTNWQKLEELKRTKGQGYQGAELKGFKTSFSNGEFIYEDIDALVD
jgi:hypothetical protein